MQFKFEPREGYLLVRATGPYDADAVRGVMADIGRICAERELARVLVDARAMVRTTASESEACEFLGITLPTCAQP